MNDKFRNKYRIGTSRLENWDYTRAGHYYVTICTHNRNNYFGNIVCRDAIYSISFSEIGKIAEQYWLRIPTHYPMVKLDEFIVMPNHVHGIIIIDDNLSNMDNNGDRHCCRDAINGVSTIYENTSIQQNAGGGITGEYNPMNKNSLSKIIRWYKGRASYEINKIKNNQQFQWQGRFYDHIIRDEKSLNKIQEYIVTNPDNWEEDKENVAVNRRVRA